MLRLLAITGFFTIAAAGTLSAQQPYQQPNNSWIALSGTVSSAAADSFLLDYGEGLITVEMDDWDQWGDAAVLRSGDEVTVYGFIDDDFYELRSIEASSVYVEGLNAYFYASGADEEDVWSPVVFSTLTPLDRLEITGTVRNVGEREFTLDTGVRELRVDTGLLPYNPLDQEGFQQIRQGDVVRVSGSMDENLFGRNEIEADTVITIMKDAGKKKAQTSASKPAS